MDRRAFISLVGGSILTVPVDAEAQPLNRNAKVGFLTSGFASLAAPGGIYHPLYQALREGFREVGYVEGQNLVIEYRFGEANQDRVVKLATELVALKPDVIVALGPDCLRAVNSLTSNIPVVTVDYEADPVAARYIASFARPGGNVTGVFLDQPELSGKWLELLKETVPKLARAAALKDSSSPMYQLKALVGAAASLAIKVEPVFVRALEDFEPAFAAAVKAHAQALVILSSPLVSRQGPRLAELAAARKLPTTSFFAEHVRTGCLMAYGPNQVEVFRRLSSQAGRILKGARAADIPSERPTKFELVINLKTAKALGLTIPQTLLLRADQVIE